MDVVNFYDQRFSIGFTDQQEARLGEFPKHAVNAAAALGRDHNANARTMLGQTTDAAWNDGAQQKTVVRSRDQCPCSGEASFSPRRASRLGTNGTLRDLVRCMRGNSGVMTMA